MVQRITCRDVSRFYAGDGVTTQAVQHINVEFTKGEFTAVVGPSGSGKSTLLSLLGTLDQPTSGEISYDEKKPFAMKKKDVADFRFEHIGFVFQQFHLLPTLTALENVMAPLFARKVSYNKTERAKEVLQNVGLSDKLHALPSQLSGGEQQRVAISRALVHEPDWLLADEPTGNLDTETGEVIFTLMQEMNRKKGCGVIFITHEPKLAEKADRILEMQDGEMLGMKSR